uniref:Uncharacterized protein n=1 Tax=Yersinia enterocolitica W22703 TaxID=913028 RepID=F4MWP7_YEREN|nr:unknown protein [Yersinia enterocolitica W22703]
MLHQLIGQPRQASIVATTAMTIPPLTYLALLSTAKGNVGRGQWWKHGLPPIGTVVCVWLAPQWLDAVVIISYLLYGTAVLLYLRPVRIAYNRFR